jgi:hypothetical protein
MIYEVTVDIIARSLLPAAVVVAAGLHLICACTPVSAEMHPR